MADASLPLALTLNISFLKSFREKNIKIAKNEAPWFLHFPEALCHFLDKSFYMKIQIRLTRSFFFPLFLVLTFNCLANKMQTSLVRHSKIFIV